MSEQPEFLLTNADARAADARAEAAGLPVSRLMEQAGVPLVPGYHGTDQKRRDRIELQSQKRDAADDRGRDGNTQRSQHKSRFGGEPQRLARGAQGAVEQDDGERYRTHQIRELEIAERDAARPVFPRQHPEPQEYEQQRRAEP
jgi:hypothetical protein